MSHKLTQKSNDPELSQKQSKKGQSNGDTAESDYIFDLSIFNQLKQLFGEKFETVIDRYSETSRKNIALAEKAIQAKDSETLERAVHSLKSSSRQFGALKLSDIAEKIEALAKENDFAAAKEKLSILFAVHEQVERHIEQQLAHRIE